MLLRVDEHAGDADIFRVSHSNIPSVVAIDCDAYGGPVGFSYRDIHELTRFFNQGGGGGRFFYKGIGPARGDPVVRSVAGVRDDQGDPAEVLVLSDRRTEKFDV